MKLILFLRLLDFFSLVLTLGHTNILSINVNDFASDEC